jgi:FkbM family methyltransferase
MKLHEHSPWWRRAARTVGRQLFRWAENNDDPRLTHNGERWLLRQLVAAHAAEAKRPFVACDGGANAGDYTRLILQEARAAGCAAEVHAFEPSPHNIERLRQAFGAGAAVRIVGAALSDRPGEAALFAGRSGSSQASLVLRPALVAAAGEAIRVPLLRLGDYLEAQGLKRINLLKLDVEGSELAALRGLGAHLSPEVIDVIQFEYGGTTADAGTTLRELYELLQAHGYVLAKLFPQALEVRTFRAWMENYAYANYVALAPRWRQPSIRGVPAS